MDSMGKGCELYRISQTSKFTSGPVDVKSSVLFSMMQNIACWSHSTCAVQCCYAVLLQQSPELQLPTDLHESLQFKCDSIALPGISTC